MTEEEKKTYLVEFRHGEEKRITVPASWKVTFGPVAVNKGTRQEMPIALRFYESDTKQRAIFTDVTSFRDMDIKITEKKVVVQEEQGFVERGGKRKATTFQAQTVEWVDPDKDEDPDLLPEVTSDNEIEMEEL